MGVTSEVEDSAWDTFPTPENIVFFGKKQREFHQTSLQRKAGFLNRCSACERTYNRAILLFLKAATSRPPEKPRE